MQKKPVDQIKSTNVSPPFLGRPPLHISAGGAVDRKWIRPRCSELGLCAGGGPESDGDHLPDVALSPPFDIRFIPR